MAIKETRRRVQSTNVEGSSPTQERFYSIWGSSDSDVIMAELLSGSPASVVLSEGTILRSEATIRADDKNETVWTGQVSYKSEDLIGQKPPHFVPTDGEEITYDIATNSTKITQSTATTSYAREKKTGEAADPVAADHGGAIGVEAKKIKGTDILIPSLTFTITHYQPWAVATDDAYVKDLGVAVGTVNDRTFRTFAAGEVLLVGVSGSPRSNVDYTMSYRFAANPNLTGDDKFDIGTIRDVEKEGWQYLWIEYEDEDDAAAKNVAKNPYSAYVETVYRKTDFATLLRING